MQPLLSILPEVEPLLRERIVMLFLDYDGTLTPIVDHPHRARLSSVRRKLLRDLARAEGVKTAIVSGRSLADLKERVGIPGLVYAGNHGLELEGPAVHFVHPEASEARKLLQEISRKLLGVFESFPGIFVEDKALSLSVHYRKLSGEKLPEARAIFQKCLTPYIGASKILLRGGKKVWEIRPWTRWNKGTLVLWLVARILARSSERALPVYVGDDETDEDAFQAIRQKGIGIKVLEENGGPSAADYFVHSSQEVFDFLKRLIRIKKGSPPEAGFNPHLRRLCGPILRNSPRPAS